MDVGLDNVLSLPSFSTVHLGDQNDDLGSGVFDSFIQFSYEKHVKYYSIILKESSFPLGQPP